MLQTAHKRAKTICQHIFMSTQSRQNWRKLNISRPPERCSGRHCHICDESLQKRTLVNTVWALHLCSTFDLQVYQISYPWNMKEITGNATKSIIADAKVLRNINLSFLCSHLSNWPCGNSVSDSRGCRNILRGFLWATAQLQTPVNENCIFCPHC